MKTEAEQHLEAVAWINYVRAVAARIDLERDRCRVFDSFGPSVKK